MSEVRGIDRWAPALSLLALCGLLAVFGAGAWAQRGDSALEKRDLERERMSRVAAGRIYTEHKETGWLPQSLGPLPGRGTTLPVAYRVVDANRFELGVAYEFARGRHGVLGLFDGAAHPSGLVWYSFDVRDQPSWTDGGPVTLDPEGITPARSED